MVTQLKGRKTAMAIARNRSTRIGRASLSRPPVRSGPPDQHELLRVVLFCRRRDLQRLAAEQLLLRLIDAGAGESMIAEMQDYRLRPAPERDFLRQRLLALRDRPQVRAAIERRARILTLPLSN
jgi:hypothetical protein